MNIIEPHKRLARRARVSPWRWVLKYGGIVLSVLVVVNFALMAVYHNRTYPRTSIGTAKIGNISYGEVQKVAEEKNVAPDKMTLTYDGRQATLQMTRLGIRIDESRTRKSLDSDRSWLPIVAIFTRHVVAAPIAMDEAKVSKAAAQTANTFHKQPVDAKVVLKGTRFTVRDAEAGYDLDRQGLQAALLHAIDRGRIDAEAPVVVRPPPNTLAAAKATAEQLQRTLTTPVRYTYGGNSKQATASDIAKWYRPAGVSYRLDDFAIRTYIATAGLGMDVRARNLTDAVAQTKQAVASHAETQVALLPYAKTKTITYCISNRGAGTAAQLPQLKETLTSTYTDLRGWSTDGQVIFKYSTSNCEFTVWMVSPDKMGTFGAICDPYWNCEVEGNVVINMDRWLHTTPSWMADGNGGVDEYRALLINHETGHMLGFGHLPCPGPDQNAPVMMQQSITRDGCKFNIWPVPTEHAMLRRMLGL